ncbi:hypothetical protein M513_04906 [Trichuris suis]|uniref:Uncharacterized protein n=1 Tax=Trichuris suis TaxID=68888 RepID=A0A085MA83_9BILA|nr:hypothetical protein M513_04906 [Trichuris suis]
MSEVCLTELAEARSRQFLVDLVSYEMCGWLDVPRASLSWYSKMEGTQKMRCVAWTGRNCVGLRFVWRSLMGVAGIVAGLKMVIVLIDAEPHPVAAVQVRIVVLDRHHHLHDVVPDHVREEVPILFQRRTCHPMKPPLLPPHSSVCAL